MKQPLRDLEFSLMDSRLDCHDCHNEISHPLTLNRNMILVSCKISKSHTYFIMNSIMSLYIEVVVYGVKLVWTITRLLGNSHQVAMQN